MSEQEFRKKLDRASEIVQSWPDWKKNALHDSFRSRNTIPREEVVLQSQAAEDAEQTDK